MRVILFAALAHLFIGCHCCTTLIAGRLATRDGSTLAAHTDDGLTDPRIMHIPLRSHAHNSTRPVFLSPEVYPRYVGYDRGLLKYKQNNFVTGTARLFDQQLQRHWSTADMMFALECRPPARVRGDSFAAHSRSSLL